MKRTRWTLFTSLILIPIFILFLFSLAAGARINWRSGPVLAQGAGPTMEVSAGFDGYCRAGDVYWCPVSVVLSNDAADVEGLLRVTRDGTGGDSNTYVKPVLSPSRSRKAYTLYFPASSSAYRTSLRVELLDGRGNNRLLAFQPADVVWLDAKEQLYGVISSRPSALNFLSDMTSVSVASVDLETLPENPLGWENLTALVLNDVDTGALTREQRRALEIWVMHGGHLIVGGGAGAARAASGVADLLPVTIGGTRSVERLWALGEWVGASSNDGPYAVVEARLRDGDVLVGQDDLSLIASRAHGAGKVTWLAFDAGLKPFSEWDDNLLLWDAIVGTWSARMNHFTIQNDYSVRNAINAIPGLQLPSTLQLLAFMLVYTALVGPVNYLVLRKMDRRELAWLTIPVLILGFSGCAYVTGFQVRGGKAIIHRLAVAYIPEESSAARVRQVVGVFSPRRTTYDVAVADVGAREISASYYGGPDRQALHVVEEAGRARLTDLRVDVGGIRPFFAEGYVETSPIESDLRVDTTFAGDMWVNGTIRIGDTPLENAVILSGYYEQRLGDLEAGEEVNVYISYTSASSSVGYTHFPERILGSASYWDDQKLYRRYQFLHSFVAYDGSIAAPLRDGIHLVGWVEDAPLAIDVVDCPFSSVGTTFYVYALPVARGSMGVKVNVPSGLISCRLQDQSTSSWSAWWGGVGHLDPDSKVELWCSIWEGVELSRVDKLQLEWQGASYGTLSGPPGIALWNHKTETWRGLNFGWGAHVIPTGESLVLPEGGIRVRLTTDPGQSVEVEQLSFSIEGRR